MVVRVIYGEESVMKKSWLPGAAYTSFLMSMVISVILPLQVKASIILNQGDVLVSDFTGPDLRGVYSTTYFVMNNGPSIGYLYLRLVQDKPLNVGDQLLVELFEGSLEEDPAHTENIYGELSGLLRTDSVTNLWADQQGVVRLTMVTGSVEFDSISATYWEHRGQRYTGEIQFTAAPVPIPAAAWLFGSGLVGLVAMTRRKKTA
jgi:hypothetical protein